MSGRPGRPPKHPTDPMLQRVFDVLESYGIDRQGKLVSFLKSRNHRVTRHLNTLRRSIERGEGVPEDWLIQVAQITKARLDWLRDGSGQPYEDDPTIATLGPGADVCLSYWERMEPTDRLLWSRLGFLLPKYRQFLGYQCELLERERSEEERKELNTPPRLGGRGWEPIDPRHG